jgi:hypothetical protein
MQALKESVPASVRRFRELGLMNKGSGPRVNVQAAAKFLQLCFRSMSYGVHAFQTCLLLEQVTLCARHRPQLLPSPISPPCRTSAPRSAWTPCCTSLAWA